MELLAHLVSYTGCQQWTNKKHPKNDVYDSEFGVVVLHSAELERNSNIARLSPGDVNRQAPVRSTHLIEWVSTNDLGLILAFLLFRYIVRNLSRSRSKFEDLIRNDFNTLNCTSFTGTGREQDYHLHRTARTR